MASLAERGCASASATEHATAVAVFARLVELGITAVPYGLALDLTVLLARGWAFPFRELAPGALAAEHDATAPAAAHGARAEAAEYANAVLTPWLLAPRFRRLRGVFRRRGASVPRLTLALEQLFDGFTNRVTARPSWFAVDVEALVPALIGGESEARELEAARARLPAPLAARLAALWTEARQFLAARVGEHPASPQPEVDAEPASRAVSPFAPTAVDAYECEHAERFTHRSDRLHARALGRLAEALGPLGALGRARRSEPPEVVCESPQESHFPAGGAAGLSARGAFESLVSAELLYLDPEAGGPDLFLVKHHERELLYFERDAGLLVRRRRHVQFVVTNAAAFAVKLPGQPYRLDVAAEALVYRVARDLFAALPGRGARVTGHWVGRGREAGAAAERFALLFGAEVERGLARFVVHENAGALRAWRDTAREQDGRGRWVFLVPPGERLAAETVARAERPGEHRSEQRGAPSPPLIVAFVAPANPAAMRDPGERVAAPDEHERQRRRFELTPGTGPGAGEQALASLRAARQWLAEQLLTDREPGGGVPIGRRSARS